MLDGYGIASVEGRWRAVPADRSMMRALADLRSARLTAALAAVVLGFLVVHAWISSSDHDEIVYLHASWLVAEGALPFKDFVEHHHPAIFYLLAPLVSFVAPNPIAAVFVGRIVNLIVVGLWIATSASILAPVATAAARRNLILLSIGCFTLLRNSLEVRPDTAMSLFCYVGLWQWLSFLRTRRSIHALASGIAYGVAVVFLQKAVLFVALVMAGSIAHLIWSKEPLGARRISAGVLLLGLGAAAPIAVFVAAIARAGILEDFYFWNYAFNQFYYLQSQASGNPASEAIAFAVREDPVLWVLGGWGVFGAARALFRRSDGALAGSQSATLLVVIAGFLVFIFRNQFPYQHNLMPLIPALAILGVLQLERVESRRTVVFWQAAMALMVVKVCVLCVDYDENKGHREIEAWVLAHSTPADTIHVTPPYHPIYRRDAYFFWYDGTRKAEPYAAYCRARGCATDRLEQDRNAPLPLLVYLPDDYPQAWPVEWDRDRAAYEETEIPHMFRRKR